MLTFIDFFAGMGTARLAFEQVGHRCVYSVEWDKHKRQIYKVVFGDEPQGGDIRSTTTQELPRADCWIAGFPCQDISVAGKQTGFQGKRSSLFFEVVRLLQETPEKDKPPYLLFENVKNFFSVNGGRDFLEALCALDEVGYDAEWDLLNSKFFGVPQNRERVLIIGHFRTGRTGKIFPLRTADAAVSKDIDILAHRNGYRKNTQVYNPEGRMECLDTCGGGGRQPHIKVVGNYGYSQHNGSNIHSIEGISPCLKQRDYKDPVKVEVFADSGQGRKYGEQNFYSALRVGGDVQCVRAVLTPDRTEKRQNGRRMKDDGEPMFSLTKQDRHGVMILDDTKSEAFGGGKLFDVCPTLRSSRSGHKVIDGSTPRIRRLTPRECFRLQAVPEYVIDKIQNAGISGTQQYIAAGDAMTVSVIYEIAKRMCLNGKSNADKANQEQ